MTIDEMFNELDDKVRDTFIVTLKYKYDFEEYYTIGNHILEYDCLDDSYVWLDDWNEGQTDVEVLGYMPLGDVDTTKLLTCEDCISREAAIDAIRKNTFRLTFAEEQNCEGHVAWSAEAVYSDVLEGALLSLPSVTPQPCDKIKEIPKDYKYDTETEDFLVYRHKYTGHEIHIEKPVPRYRLEQPSFEEWLSSFNTESAPQCFNAVQELKKQIEKKQNT